MLQIQRRQNENVPPVPEAVDIPPYAPEAKCDDYDGYLYSTKWPLRRNHHANDFQRLEAIRSSCSASELARLCLAHRPIPV